MKKILPVFSYVFHPIFIPVMATFFYFLFDIANFKTEEIIFLFSQIILITVLIPIVLFFMLRSIGTIDSMMFATISQRKMPLIFQCFLIILLLRKTIIIEHYMALHFFFLGVLFSTLIALLMLFVQLKASLHMLGISALVVFVFGLSVHYQANAIYWISFLVLMNGFVAFSRLIMQAHSPKELIIGLLIGSVPQLLLFFLWL